MTRGATHYDKGDPGDKRPQQPAPKAGQGLCGQCVHFVFVSM
jgi:hypothetical protein